jgi:hypothetical protein
MFWSTLAAGLLASATLLSAQALPSGTALPVALNTTINSKNNKPGQKIEGKLVQEVMLPAGVKIKAGSHVTGHIVSVKKLGATGSSVVVQFDALQDEHQTLPLNVSLRALAATESVFQAKTPVDSASADEGSNSWVTKQVGGDIVFRGRGYVSGSQGKVAIWSGTGVWGKLSSDGACPGSDSNNAEQALWVFSTTACGAYGFEDLKITAAGDGVPSGQITLHSTKDVLVRSGSGWLLLVNPASATPATAP